MRILAADDDDSMIRVLGRYLRGWGYEATVARNGYEAWQILKRSDAPRVAILDWDMPGMTGLEVCRLFRSTAHGAGAYVLLLTGRLEKEDLVEALESGADDFLSKPFDARELQLRLAKGIRAAERALPPGERTPGGAGVPPTGSLLGGKYRLEHKIGEGGMGSVWMGVHLALRIDVAIKFMAAKLAESAAYASFEREARAAAQLRNEHTVRVYDHGISEEGSPYLVMEYLQGKSLSEWVEREGPLTPSLAASLVEQVARALTEAHGRGIVHRDIKPDNILLVDDKERAQGFMAKVIDFGLAKERYAIATPSVSAPRPARPLVGAAEPQSDMGGTRFVDRGIDSSRKGREPSRAGTPLYMSPESLSEGGPPSPHLDLWALAATAFFALTGELPFYGDSLAEVLRCVCQDPLPVPSQVHRGLSPAIDAWFARACARDPAARFQSANELAAAFSAACRDDTPALPSGKIVGPRTYAPTEPER